MKVSERVPLWISWSVHSLELFSAVVNCAMTSASVDNGFCVNHEESVNLRDFNGITPEVSVLTPDRHSSLSTSLSLMNFDTASRPFPPIPFLVRYSSVRLFLHVRPAGESRKLKSCTQPSSPIELLPISNLWTISRRCIALIIFLAASRTSAAIRTMEKR